MATLERAHAPELVQPHTAPAVDIVVPVRDEARVLAASIHRLHEYLMDSLPWSFRITVADNGSSDETWKIAAALAVELPHVRAVHFDRPGRGRALHDTWSQSDAAVLAYMDVDLSTDLAALLPLIAPLVSGHSDLAIGSRLTHGARVVRGPKRELISRAYNALLHTLLRAHFSDAQCGFKAIRADRAHTLLPFVQDRGWFFDTELLVLAERMGFRIHEVPVDWTDDPDSRVDLVKTAAGDLKGVARLARDLARGRVVLPNVGDPSFGGQVVRFAVIGVSSTLAYLALYAVLRGAVPAQAANAVALLATAIANTAANRHFTFSIRGNARMLRHQVQGLVVFALALALTSGSLALLQAHDPRSSRAVELAVLTAANLIATILRFVLLRIWVFREAAR
jgi:glycosyltransferase involved in cell wall biosynthesis